MNESVSDIIVARGRADDRLGSMLAWSVAVHLAVTAFVVMLPAPEAEPPVQVMMISLGGAPGPQTGGLTQIGGRAVQAPAPPDAPRRADTAPAKVAPPMTLPDPKARPQRAARQAPREATAPTPNTGPEPREGSTRAETQNRGQGFGLSSAGGAGGGITFDVKEFCCPEYIVDMRRRIQQVWNEKQGIVGVTTMRFTITRDGTITAIGLDKSSGFDRLDREAQRALVLTQRLGPLPSRFPNPTLTVHMEFEYAP